MCAGVNSYAVRLCNKAYMHSKAPRPLRCAAKCELVPGQASAVWGEGRGWSPVMGAWIVAEHAHVRCVAAASEPLHQAMTRARTKINQFKKLFSTSRCNGARECLTHRFDRVHETIRTGAGDGVHAGCVCLPECAQTIRGNSIRIELLPPAEGCNCQYQQCRR